MISRSIFIALLFLLSCAEKNTQKVFDVHLHGDTAPEKQLGNLKANGVQVVAVSTSWQEQQAYNSTNELKVMRGIFVPCPGGMVPYSKQLCFDNGSEWPDPAWVEEQIVNGKIDFIGEVLAQYYGISSSDTLMYPYYSLAEKYNLPVGIHTGSAGPDHGCPNFKEEMGNPLLLKNALNHFPKLKAWLMHGGTAYPGESIAMMKAYPGLYADISVLNNPRIIPPDVFGSVIKQFIDAGFEDRLMFGSDNADIKVTVEAINQLSFLSKEQKEKIFYRNAMSLFR